MARSPTPTAPRFMAQIDGNLVSCALTSRAAVVGDAEDRRRRTHRQCHRAAGIEPRHGGGMTAYATSKAAVAAFTQALAAELIHENILVNAVAPGTMDTPANRASMPKADPDEMGQARRRRGRPFSYLASPDNRVTSGGIVPVYGRS